MSLHDRLHELARITGGESPVVSVYLNTRWADEHQRDRVRIFVKNEIEKARRTRGGRTLEGDLDWIASEADALVQQARFPDALGVALFACGALGLREVLPVGAPFEDAFVVDPTPFLRPMAALLDEAPAALIVFADSARARLIPLTPIGEVDEIALESDVPGRHRRGGWAQLAQSRYQRHILDHRARHLEAVGRTLADMADTQGLDRIVLAGEPRILSALRAELPAPIAARVTGEIPGAHYEGAAAFRDRARDLLGRVEALAEAHEVGPVLVEAAKSGRAVSGLAPALEAVERGAVHRLYLLRGFAVAGRACDGCGRLQSGADPTCRRCGSATRERELGAAMVDRVIAAGGQVEMIEAHDELARAGGVAARLRYPL